MLDLGTMSELIAGIPSWALYGAIIFVSIIATTIILERGWVLLRKTKNLNPEDERRLISLLQDKKYDEAISFCRMQSHPAFQVAMRLIETRSGDIALENIAEEEIMRQLQLLERYLPTLGSISTIAPLLGLLGTVIGMIDSFAKLAVEVKEKKLLAVGIDKALITTALGLMVAIPSLIMFNYYVRRVSLLGDETDIIKKMVIDELNK